MAVFYMFNRLLDTLNLVQKLVQFATQWCVVWIDYPEKI